MKKLISKLFTLSNIEQKIEKTCSSDEIYSGWTNKFGCIPTTNFSIPVDLHGLSGVITVAEGTYHSAALKEDGTVWTWGVNWFGQLGNSTTSDNEIPTMVENISKISTISIWAWGSNLYGQLGNGSNAIQKNIPVMVIRLTDVIDIATGMYNTVALRNDGTIWAWGLNVDEKPDGAPTISSTPTKVGVLSKY